MHYYKKLWHEFIHADKTLPAIKRDYPEWHKGRDRYFLWAITLRNDSVSAKINAIKPTLASYLVHPYIRQLHITLYVCGFMVKEKNFNDNYDMVTRERQIALLQQLDLTSFDLSLGAVNSFLSAPFVEIIDPTGSLIQIRKTLLSLHDEIRTTEFTPHITLGIYKDEYNCQEISKVLQSYESFADEKLCVNKLSLMSYSATDIGSSLCVEHEIILRENVS